MSEKEPNYQHFTAKGLKEELKKLKLSTSGNKSTLLQRLNQFHFKKEVVEAKSKEDELDETFESLQSRKITASSSRMKLENNNSVKYSLRDVIEILLEFDPEKEKGLSAEEFIKRSSKLKMYYEWSDAEMLMAIGLKLKGYAKSWFEKEEDVFSSWNAFVMQFNKKFSPVLNDADVHMTLMARKRERNETLLEYLEEMSKIGLKGRINENAIVKYFIVGMRDDELYSALQSQRVENLNELRDKVEWCVSLRKNLFKPKQNIHQNVEASRIINRSTNSKTKKTIE